MTAIADQERLELTIGDISRIDADAVVTSANTTLHGNRGVAGAVRRAAGPGFDEDCNQLGTCPTGAARITGGHGLDAKFVIQTVAPVYKDGKHGEPEQLQSCYRSALQLAERNGVDSVAFPLIGTGGFGYPKPEASEIALRAIREWLGHHKYPERVILCCHRPEDAELLNEALTPVS